eukprot:scaffold416431_cov24-Attheya_sp.AAC.1
MSAPSTPKQSAQTIHHIYTNPPTGTQRGRWHPPQLASRRKTRDSRLPGKQTFMSAAPANCRLKLQNHYIPRQAVIGSFSGV